MDTVMCLTSTSNVRGRSEFTMGTATPQSLKTKTPIAPRGSSNCSKTCKAIVAALSVPQEALIQHNPGDSRDPKSIQYPTACRLTLQEKGSSAVGTGRPQPLHPGLSSWLSLMKSMVPICASAAGVWGQLRGHQRLLLLQGPALWVLCSFALFDGRHESPASSCVSFVIPWWPISAPHAENWSGPSGEQTLSSGHLPFEAFQKGKRALKTEKLQIGLLKNKK